MFAAAAPAASLANDTPPTSIFTPCDAAHGCVTVARDHACRYTMLSIAAQNVWSIVILIASLALLRQVKSSGKGVLSCNFRGKPYTAAANMVCSLHWHLLRRVFLSNRRICSGSCANFKRIFCEILLIVRQGLLSQNYETTVFVSYISALKKCNNLRRLYHGCAWVMWATAGVCVYP